MGHFCEVFYKLVLYYRTTQLSKTNIDIIEYLTVWLIEVQFFDVFGPVDTEAGEIGDSPKSQPPLWHIYEGTIIYI